MIFEQIYLGCLSQASYLIGDRGEAVVVDPRRDVDVYLAMAKERGLVIRRVLLTHLHADFVAGHCELARRTGAEICIGARAPVEFPHRALSDGDVLAVGGVRVRVLETPGHTPESVCYLVEPGDGGPPKLLTGDTLFIGDVGRPDLVGGAGLTAEQMAGTLWESLRAKVLPLPDETELWPGHGAGSACGKSLSSERWSTLGAQRVANPMLADLSRDEFVELATEGLGTPPRYFAFDAAYNKRGAPGLDELPPVPELAPDAVERAAAGGALVLDVRDREAFGAGHVPGALNLGLDGSFASWAGSLVDARRELVLVAADAGKAAEARMRLARVGLERVVGSLAGGVDAWRASGRPLAALRQEDPAELARRLAEPGLLVLDVRAPGEHGGGHVPGALNVPLRELEERAGELDLSGDVAVVCQSGYRSSAAASLLAARGARALSNVRGGTAGWIAAGLPVEAPVPAR